MSGVESFSDRLFHYRNLLISQAVQLIDKLVNGLVGGGYLALEALAGALFLFKSYVCQLVANVGKQVDKPFEKVSLQLPIVARPRYSVNPVN